jgi:hypothetical protein
MAKALVDIEHPGHTRIAMETAISHIGTGTSAMKDGKLDNFNSKINLKDPNFKNRESS